MSKKSFNKSLFRPNIKNITPYASARDEFDGDAEVYLDANENSLGSPLSDRFAPYLNRYPDPHHKKLRKLISSKKNIPLDNIFLGNGSDEGIDLLIKIFCSAQTDSVLVTPPTYGMYKIAALNQYVDVIESPLDEKYDINADSILKKCAGNTKIIFLCSPNNPTGNLLNQTEIIKILDNFKGIVVIDEAYLDYTEQISFLNQLENYPNLVVLQTLSKAWGLAGLRLGIVYANNEIIEVLYKIKSPYNLNSITQELAFQAIKSDEFLEYAVSKTIQERENLRKSLSSIPAVKKIHPSVTNFLLVEIADATAVYKKLIAEGIVVRNRSNITQCENCLRITIGTPAENNKLLEALGAKIDIKEQDKSIKIVRKTRETNIIIEAINIGKPEGLINTGIGFLDHMLELFAFHSGLKLIVQAQGDLETDPHHLIEDIGLCLGSVLYSLVLKNPNNTRYSFILPMDETRAEVVLDLCGRPSFVWKVDFNGKMIGNIPSELFSHFFKSLTDNLKCALHITSVGENDHHIIEGIFKCFGKAFKQAFTKSNVLQSTKGIL